MRRESASLPARLDDVARERPDRTAVVCGDEIVSYGRLQAAADALAARLDLAGARRGDVVAVASSRSPATIAALLAAWRIGAAFMPVDPREPAARLASMLRQARPAAFVGKRDLEPRLPNGLPLVVAEETPRADARDGLGEEAAVTPGRSELAYVVYTSGSTGSPKGVAVTHGNLEHATSARLGAYRQPGVLALPLALTFDAALGTIVWTLAAGGMLVLPAEGSERDPARLRALIRGHAATHLVTVPTLYSAVLDADAASLGTLAVVIVGGEKTPAELVRTHATAVPGAALFTEYGPTETAHATIGRLDAGAPSGRIGSPIPGASLRLLADDLEPVAPGRVGEVFISGPGVSLG
jgi:non-ribosomal peptide synthetase component F